MGLYDRQYYREPSEQLNIGFDRRSMVATLIIINVVIFLADSFTPKQADGSQWLSDWMAIKQKHPWHLWNYLTYGFAHASIMTGTGVWHVLGNMFSLFMLGKPVEDRLGSREFLRFYLVAIIVSGIGFTVFRFLLGIQFGLLVGASGAVSAVIALFIFFHPRATLLMFGVIPMPAWLLGVFLLAQNLLVALNPDSPTAWDAHLIGFAFGAAYFRWHETLTGLIMNPFGANPFRGKPKLKVHNPWSDEEDLKEKADSILQKIVEQGEASLTKKERQVLQKYSEQVRKQRR